VQISNGCGNSQTVSKKVRPNPKACLGTNVLRQKQSTKPYRLLTSERKGQSKHTGQSRRTHENKHRDGEAGSDLIVEGQPQFSGVLDLRRSESKSPSELSGCEVLVDEFIK